MLTSKERIVSILICIVLAIIIKLNFFNSNHNNEKNQIDNIKSYYYEEKPSLLSSKLRNTINYKVINIFPRKNPTVYTQGLFYYNYSIYESGGLYKKSTLTHMEWPSQKIIQQINLAQNYFAEGIAGSISNNILYQLTYKEKEILQYSFPNLELKTKFEMPKELNEGWGMCTGRENDEFYATDGSDKIFTLKINENQVNQKDYIQNEINNYLLNYKKLINSSENYLFKIKKLINIIYSNDEIKKVLNKYGIELN
jgi:glutamine cyclotransferase